MKAQVSLFETMEQWQSKHTLLKHWGCSDCALLLYNRLTSRQGTSDKRQAVSLCFTDCGAKFTSFTGNCLLNWREHLRQTQIRQTFSVSLFDFAGKQTDASITHSGRLYWQPFMAVANKKKIYHDFNPSAVSNATHKRRKTLNCFKFLPQWGGERLHKITIVSHWQKGPLVVGRENGAGREWQGPGEREWKRRRQIGWEQNCNVQSSR